MTIPASSRPAREWLLLIIALLVVGGIVAPLWQFLGGMESREQLAQLRALMGEMDEASRDANAARYIELNIAFHAKLYEASGNARLAALDGQMGKELRIYRRHGLAFGGGLAVSNIEHRAILAAVEQGDCANAGRELEKHILNGRDRFIRAMSATGQLVLNDVPTKPNRKRA